MDQQSQRKQMQGHYLPPGAQMTYVTVNGRPSPAIAFDSCHIYHFRHQTKVQHPIHIREILRPGEWEAIVAIRAQVARRRKMETIIQQIETLEPVAEAA